MAENAKKGKRVSTVTEQDTPTVDVNALAEQVARLEEQNRQLMLALISAREVATPASADVDANIRVENTSGMTIGFEVTDLRGLKIPVSLERRGSFKYLTRTQVQEAMEKFPHFFQRGYISAPDVIPDSANVVKDIQAYLDSLAFTDVNAAIAKIDAVETLHAIFNHIENQRFTHLDDSGKPMFEKDEHGALIPLMKEVEVDPKLLLVEQALQRRMSVLASGTRLSIDGN